jgi:dihydroorotate dehydrogenase (fumarate)
MDLTTNYVGLRLKNPVVAGASPLSRDIDSIRALEDAGVSAIVLYSLFQEQIEHEHGAHEHFQQAGAETSAEALSYMPALDYFPRGPEEYVEHVGRAKEAVNVPVFASLNGTTIGGWVEYARKLQEAGADGLELNVYHLATDPEASASQVEDQYLEIVRAVKSAVRIPVALKLGPFFSSLAHFAKRLDESNVDGLVLFNRFYQPDIDLEALDVVPNLTLSAPHELRLPLRWIAVLDPLIDASLAASTGVYTAGDVLKLLLAGADVTMLCAALLRTGPSVVTTILTELTNWLEEHEYEGVRQLKGSMNHRTSADPGAFERANYMQALQSYA